MLKQFGAMYLILGTCVAAGMLGLPVVTANNHFFMTSVMIISAWILMTSGAWCLLQVTLWMKPGANLISMSEATLGHFIKIITWFIYLILLYSLICAYLSASGDLLEHFIKKIVAIPRSLATIFAAMILGSVVMHGIRSVDFTNRILMSVKLIICLLLIGTVMPFVHVSNLMQGKNDLDVNAWLVIICAFGYAIILPSIRDYLNSNRKHLNRVIWIGSILPMILYFAWVIVIQGALQRYDAHGLISMNNSPNTNSMLMTQIAALTHHAMIKTLSVAFISICSITGFLGVSLCLVDFLADGLKKQKKGKNKLLLALLAFLPPTLIVIFDPAIFIRALAYAGVCCLYILIALPIAMYAVGRYKKLGY